MKLLIRRAFDTEEYSSYHITIGAWRGAIYVPRGPVAVDMDLIIAVAQYLRNDAQSEAPAPGHTIEAELPLRAVLKEVK